MPFQFCCPQGHVLQGDESQVGQVSHCPMCGSNFLIPPPEMRPPAAGGFSQGAGTWPGANAPGPAYPTQGGMPGMMPQQSMPPMMPGGQMPMAPYPMPQQPMPQQPFAFNSAQGNPAGAPAAPAQQPVETAPQGETDKPRFDLGFDPTTKHSLPFEFPGQSEEENAPVSTAGPPAPAYPNPSFPTPQFSAPSFSDSLTPPPDSLLPSMPATFQPVIDGPDFLEAAPKGADVPDFLNSMPGAANREADSTNTPKILHFRCPMGHLVMAKSDLLGKTGRCQACQQTFEIRYEDSVEFKRRKAKLIHRDEIKTGNAWVAWAFLGAFLVFVAIIAVLFAMNTK